jgi:hypothetical protein
VKDWSFSAPTIGSRVRGVGGVRQTGSQGRRGVRAIIQRASGTAVNCCFQSSRVSVIAADSWRFLSTVPLISESASVFSAAKGAKNFRMRPGPVRCRKGCAAVRRRSVAAWRGALGRSKPRNPSSLERAGGDIADMDLDLKLDV